VASQGRRYTLDAEDVARIHSINVTTDALVVVFQTQKLENTLGSNGIPKCKKL